MSQVSPGGSSPNIKGVLRVLTIASIVGVCLLLGGIAVILVVQQHNDAIAAGQCSQLLPGHSAPNCLSHWSNVLPIALAVSGYVVAVGCRIAAQILRRQAKGFVPPGASH